MTTVLCALAIPAGIALTLAAIRAADHIEQWADGCMRRLAGFPSGRGATRVGSRSHAENSHGDLAHQCEATPRRDLS